MPFLLLAVAAHLAVAHLLWRILNRSGVPPWGAVAANLLAVLLMLDLRRLGLPVW